MFSLLLLLFFDTYKKVDIYEENHLKDEKIPIVEGNKETCLVCHGEMDGFSSSHDPSAIGCSSCHLGNPYTLDKEESHKGMILIPGNLQNSYLTCGKCHDKIEKDIHHSIMATGRGIVTVNRYVFSEAKTPDGKGHLSNLRDDVASEKHARQLCATCHLNYEKKITGPIDERSRGGGCNACHLKYSEEAKLQLSEYQKDKNQMPSVHPSLSQSVDNSHCFGCHSRSGRISTSFEGWHETMLKSIPSKKKSQYRKLMDGRIFVKMPDDVHHSIGMSCIDCHTSTETMGNGVNYNHKEYQLEVSCEDCHKDDWNSKKIKWIKANKLDETSKRIIELRDLYQKEREFLISIKKKTPLVNLYRDVNGSIILEGKINQKKYILKENSKKCLHARKNHENVRCESCHNDWAPQCITCHTGYYNEKKAYDHLKRDVVNGRYVETFGGFLAKKPVLGVLKTEKGEAKVTTFSPGMVLTIEIPKDLENFYTDFSKELFFNKEKNMYEIFKRLHAPGFSHTIQRKSRSCESCHWSSHALGWGEGTLHLSLKANDFENLDEFIRKKIIFESYYVDHRIDHLPIDAWIYPLEEIDHRRDVSTRSNTRPFNSEEQLKILRPGYCMQCHDPSLSKNQKLYDHFSKSVEIFERCRKNKSY